jgi:hypothetical protein
MLSRMPEVGRLRDDFFQAPEAFPLASIVIYYRKVRGRHSSFPA